MTISRGKPSSKFCYALAVNKSFTCLRYLIVLSSSLSTFIEVNILSVSAFIFKTPSRYFVLVPNSCIMSHHCITILDLFCFTV